jgi:hypothetical protein
MPVGKTYAIYYGWLSDDESGEPNARARALAKLRLPLIVANYAAAPPASHVNLSPQVIALMRNAGTAVFAYIATNWGNAERRRTLSAIDDDLAAGVDGVFFDEADSLCTDAKLEYYAALAARVRAKSGRIILNAGVPRCGEKIMELCDFLMVEHAWREARTRSPWLRRYPTERVMGVSSNEENAMGYAVDEQRAIEDTRQAWQAGIGWHTSTNRYIELPEWFGRYVSAVE